MTVTAGSDAPGSSSISARTTRSRVASPARSSPERRSISAVCVCTAPSSAGAWRGAPASVATTCSSASSGRPARCRRRLVVAAEAIPEVQLEALVSQLGGTSARQVRQHRVHRLLLGDTGVERLLATEAGGDLQRLAPVFAEALERADEELLVSDRLSDLERRMPGGEHRQIVLVEICHGLGVMRLELALRDLVDPRPDDLAEQLPTCLAADGIGDDADRVLRFDEAEWHAVSGPPGVARDCSTVSARSDSTNARLTGRNGRHRKYPLRGRTRWRPGRDREPLACSPRRSEQATARTAAVAAATRTRVWRPRRRRSSRPRPRRGRIHAPQVQWRARTPLRRLG